MANLQLDKIVNIYKLKGVDCPIIYQVLHDEGFNRPPPLEEFPSTEEGTLLYFSVRSLSPRTDYAPKREDSELLGVFTFLVYQTFQPYLANPFS